MDSADASHLDVAPGPDMIGRLLRAQAPHLAQFEVRETSTSGSSNWVYRLGEELAVRVPRTDGYSPDLLNEVRWLPRIADELPVAVPEVVVIGEPTEECPRPWTVVSWRAGDLPVHQRTPGRRRASVAVNGSCRRRL